MQVCINYPNPHITIHKDASCKQVQMHHKEEQRRIRIRVSNLKSILTDFINENYDFKPQKEWNDMWLDISLNTYDQEIGLVHTLQAIIGQRYRPLGDAPISVHCQ